ncbi:UNVERIFIED_CONTAM: hypothetical protein GTU68_024475 [Idotea baltica]|nr:hypothetical protein [Idotea baltica]
MITKITGTLLSLTDTTCTIAAAPFEYEVFITDFTRRSLQLKVGEDVSLHTIDYIDGNPQKGGRMNPRLVGFDSVIERQFFEIFCSVPGLGVKKALRALVRPVGDIANSIEQQDVKALTTMPGIGAAMAEKIVAQLRRKMAKFALLVQQSPSDQSSDVELNIVDETYQVLIALGHAESDARKLLEVPLATKKKFKNVEALLQAVYEQNQ